MNKYGIWYQNSTLKLVQRNFIMKIQVSSDAAPC